MPVLSEDSGLHETLALLTSQLRPDSNHKEEMVFLKDIFSERSLSYLMKIHEKLCHYERQSPVPVLHSASALAEDVIEELQTAPINDDEKELLQLLSTPHLRAMLVVHDTVAQKNFDPVLPPLPDNFDEDFDEESVKIVRLVKNKEPLGATIRRDEHTGAVIVARIMRGGAADRSGLVHVGDELREVNGVAVLHKRPEEISQILAQSQGSIMLKIIPAIKEEDRLKESKVFMRALFSYNPKEDKAIPCQEAGLPFQRRQILEVVSQDDPTWWQAKRMGDTNLRAGLIPSKQFQERRLMYRRTIGALHNTRSTTKPLCSLGSRLNELKQKVVAENPQEYGVAVPHTTRSKKSHEKEGVEYNFVSKQSFETDVQHNKFVEHGEYKENLYGTSLEAIQSVMSKNKVCLVDVVPEAMKHLRTPEFKPYVVFVKPLISEKKKIASKSLAPDDLSVPLDEEQLEMANSAAFIEEQYGHLIDTILVKEDLHGTCSQLKAILEKLNTDSFWVPVSWVRS
ncbi:MAGUK p55 subfamily member 3 isoform X3 [Paroedura picta]|uniref:MAGUK p55 subfamily member 3 isoform X3 n=1 Tax=Paroedura picta TaxID=143630 RepID=UPI0040570A00